jgi:hypothetical protein
MILQATCAQPLSGAHIAFSREYRLESTLSDSAVQAGVTVDITRKLETSLNRMGATGKGLHEKVTSIETRLPDALQRKLRYVASVRNNLSHNDVVLPAAEFDSFTRGAQDALRELQAIADAPPQVAQRMAAPRSYGAQNRRGFPLGMLLVVAAAIVFLFTQYRNASEQPAATADPAAQQVDPAAGTTGTADASDAAQQPSRSADAADAIGSTTGGSLAAEPQAAPQNDAPAAPPVPAPRPAHRKHAASHTDANAAHDAPGDASQPADAADDTSPAAPGASRIPLNTVRDLTQGL